MTIVCQYLHHASEISGTKEFHPVFVKEYFLVRRWVVPVVSELTSDGLVNGLVDDRLIK